MLVTFQCQHCSARLRIDANAMGTRLNCPECDGEIDVPKQRLGPGFVVGGFLIKHKIGQGGMGEVYLARQLSLERDVALKLLPSQYTHQSSFIVRFLKEVHYQAKLDHPNIVTAYDAGEDNGVYFMAMAYVAGETLEDRLDRDGPLSETDSLKLIRQVAQALQYASEQKGILHRDIKPGNIMVTPTLHAKVLDMGLSKNTMEKYSSTHADTLLGTPNYMSPEQIDHPQQIDTRSDMFSLGMTFYHLITGQVPFEDSSYLKTLKRHSQEKLDDPRGLMPGISRHSTHLIARMTARDPEQRFADWEALLEAIDHALAGTGEPVNLPEDASTLEVDPAFDPPPPPLPKSAPATVPAVSRPTPRLRRIEGIILSIAAGLALGGAGIGLLLHLAPLPEFTSPVPAPSVTPRPAAPEADPLPELPPGPDLDRLQRDFTDIILAFERSPASYDQTISDLLSLAEAARDTPLARSVTEQLLRVRRSRDQAVDDLRRRLRETSLRILQEQGAPAAREYLIGFTSPFDQEVEGTLDHLLRQIDAWEQQENQQREQDFRLAEERFSDLLRDVVPLVLLRDWSAALLFLDSAAAQPALFPVADRLGLLRLELVHLRRIPQEILARYRNVLQQEIEMDFGGTSRRVRVREVRPDGILVALTLRTTDGTPVGTAEEFILFSQLSARELLRRMESMNEAHHDLYRGLIAQQSGNMEAARLYLQAADTELSRAILAEFTTPALPFSPRLQPIRDLN